MMILEHGPSVGRYYGRDIPAWIADAEGAFDYDRVAGPSVEMADLADDEYVISPGLVYKRRGRNEPTST